MTEILVSTHRPRLDDRPLRHRIGLIALATDHTSEVDYARMLAAQGVGVYVNRIPYANPVTPQTLAAMEPDLAAGRRTDPAGRGSGRGGLRLHLCLGGDR